MAADVTKQVQCIQVNFTGTSGATPVFLGGVKKVIMRSSVDCFVDFDQPVAPTTSYKVLAANTADTTVDLEMGLIRNLYVQAVSGNGTLFVIIIAG